MAIQSQSREQLKAPDGASHAGKEPWLHMARFCFKNKRYGEAIIYANEALKRDSRDIDARSIAAVGGLRVFTDAIAELKRDQEKSGKLVDMERALTELLRDSVGEPLLGSPGGRDKRP